MIRTLAMRAAIDLLQLAPEAVERPAPGTAPTAFRVWHAGDNPTDKGATIFTSKSADLLMTAQGYRGNLYSIDVDHLSLNPVAPPEARKAVGWHRLEVRTDSTGKPELWAVDVQWTDVARGGLEKNPPEWRYFSPAYDVSKETREVISYLNTALTNNPATWQVTALATRATEVHMTEEERKKARAAIALLKAMSEGDDEEEDKRAKAALAALELDGDEPEPKEKPPSEEDKRKASEAAAQKAAAEKKASDDEEAKRAAAQKSAEEGDKCKDAVNATVISLAKRVQELEADKQRDAQAKEQAERARLLAGLVPDVQKALKDVPLESLRGVVAALPKVPGAVSVRASVAAQFPGSTRGEGQHGGDEPIGMLTNMSGHGPELDRAMGLEPTDNPVQWKGTRLSTRAMTRREAKTVLAGLAASEKSAAERVA